MKDVMAQIAEDNFTLVQHQTFGHLFPDDGSVFEGKLLLGFSIYGDIVVLNEEGMPEGSPWWYAAVNEFAGKQYSLLEDKGYVFELEVKVMVSVLEDENIELDEDGDPIEPSTLRTLEIERKSVNKIA